ncbi:Apc15p protein-domain-containing protein [Exophiala viscosa]|uniref:Apc15p protein-domain-containing protein n=1 Tax=Exophiala viscosa TaxID=2486360 RepID=A0AAN6E1Y8_9EURO|nr:Apc15p protein-domain-containing protein [Exophiala viscosa]
MLLTTSLPLFPPPASSLLPPLTQPTPDHTSNQPHQHQSRRNKQHASALHRTTTLAVLSSDERTIVQRKMAIAMYGYSWLKPAGCPKTMLGRREEEVEREEVERQLREVELQERLQQEAEEQERLAQQTETGEPEGDRDLDEDIPDADAGEEEGDLDEDDEEEEEVSDGDDGLGGDLDDEIPDADDQDDDEVMSPAGDDTGTNWTYDTRREPDSDEEGGASARRYPGRQGRHAHIAGVRIPVPGSEYDYDEREAEDLANAMLDEDEIFEQDDDAAGGERDLDDDVPDAAESDQAWEHTDTELEESEMDISILPVPGQARSSIGHGGRLQPQIAGGPRRASGPRNSEAGWGFNVSPQVPPRAGHSHRPTPEMGHPAPRAAVSGNRHHRQLRAPYFHTPAMLDSPMDAETQGTGASDDDGDIDADPFASSGAGPRPIPRPHPHGLSMLASATEEVSHDRTGRTGAGTTAVNVSGSPSPSRATAARAWLDGAAAAVGGSARRTLFGRSARRGAAGAVITDTSSGGLFTPPSTSTAAVVTAESGVEGEWETPVNNASQDPGQTQAHQRRRSGRFLGSRRRADMG